MALTFLPFSGKNIFTDIFAVGRRYRSYLYVFMIMVSYITSILISFPSFSIDADRWGGLSPQNIIRIFITSDGLRMAGSLGAAPAQARVCGIHLLPVQGHQGSALPAGNLFIYFISQKRWVVPYRQVCAEIPLCKYFYLATEKSCENILSWKHLYWQAVKIAKV